MESKCVGNDFDSGCGVNIITGSNMGGKTSFLRTLGINIILMNSGSFVCAKKFSACYFKIFTSMRVSDDISRGISTFYGELLRIKDMIEYVDCGNMLVLIDEIFKGTNYQDRIYGAKEVIKRLTTDRTIVLLTTHDFELCEEENICNYYVKEEYVDNQIVFDYKMQISTSSCFGSVINVSHGISVCDDGTPVYIGWNNPNPGGIGADQSFSGGGAGGQGESI